MNENKNAAINEMLMLGIGILIIGLILGVYSITTYVEVKNLSEKVDFDMIENNTKLTNNDKFYEYLTISEFLNKKLNQNKNIPIKNTSCVYLDYAQQNAILMYNIANRKFNNDATKKSQAATNIRTLHGIYDNYKNCKQTAGFKEELAKYIKEIENAANGLSDRDEQMNKFINEYKDKKQTEDFNNYEEMTVEQRMQLEQDMQNIQQWQDEPQTSKKQHVLVPMDDAE